MALTDFHQTSRREAQKGTMVWTGNDIFKDDRPSVNVNARHGFVYDAAHQQPIRRDRRQSVLKSTPAACSF